MLVMREKTDGEGASPGGKQVAGKSIYLVLSLLS